MGSSGHGADLPELGWPEFFGTWSAQLGWLIPLALIGGFYLWGRRRAGASGTVPGWRVACFLTGLVLTWIAVASAIGGYAMALTWMHMVLHLSLIMVIPALLVLGHPLTVLVETWGDPGSPGRDRVERIMRGRTVGLFLNSVTGTLVYSVTIIGTHLTGFMDAMAQHHSLMVGEQVLYLVAGYMFLVPLLGEEPIRSNPSYLWRLGLLVFGMIPDTIVGIVMLQTDRDLYPVYTSMRPDWALDAVRDIQTAGALMWAGGDGGMMFMAIGLAIAAVTSPKRRSRMLGSWLEGVRSATLVEHAHNAGVETETPAEALDADSDEALEAYNRMLQRMAEHEENSDHR